MVEHQDQYHRFRHSIAGTFILFSLIVAIAVIAHSNILPKAVAAINIKADQPDQWSQYMSWHQSWHYSAASDRISAACRH